MTIVIDIEEKVNSEIDAGHISRREIERALNKSHQPLSKLFKLHVTDDVHEAGSLISESCLVIPILTDSNSDFDFSAFKYLITNSEDIDEDFYYKIWQRYMGLSWHILETKRCNVREMNENDISALYEIYRNPSITRFTEPLFPDYEDELEYTRNYIHNVYEYFGFGTWIIEEKETGKIIGRAGFNYRPGYDYPEIGYVIDTQFQNKGYATEVCTAIINYGMEELEFKEILAFSSPDNTPGIKLLSRLGFSEAKDISEPADAQTLGFSMKAFIYKQ